MEETRYGLNSDFYPMKLSYALALKYSINEIKKQNFHHRQMIYHKRHVKQPSK